MKLSVSQAFIECLQQYPEQKFTAQQIAKWILSTYPEECREKQERSSVIDSDESLMWQIIREIGGRLQGLQKQYSGLKTIEERPRKYYFTELDDSVEIGHAVSGAASPIATANDSSIAEHNLYPKLSEFLWSEYKIYSKRINEKRSSNSQGPDGNKWLHPDLVGMEDLSREWNLEIKNCVKQYSDKKLRLWSFEVKKEIKRSDIRGAFFQSVSNSSWANFGYLVACKIMGDAMKELRILTSLHGIGVMQLNYENPPESQVMIPAKERFEVDWDTANRLAEENPDFLKYIKAIYLFHQNERVYPSDWDTKIDED